MTRRLSLLAALYLSACTLSGSAALAAQENATGREDRVAVPTAALEEDGAAAESPVAGEAGVPAALQPDSEMNAVPARMEPEADAEGAAAEPSQETGVGETVLETTPTAETAPPAALRGPKKQVYGWIEDVLIDPLHALKLPAKLDTGADTTSLDARNIRRSRRDGEDYVRFVVTEPATGQSVELEKPFVRAVRIKGHGNDLARRVVVRMRICIGDRSRSVEVNLVDRAHYEYPLLLGRNALRDVAMIDPNLRRTREPSCWAAAEPWMATAPAGAEDLEVRAEASGADVTQNNMAPSDTRESRGGATASCENAPMC